jgi:hypothetical protein
MAGIPPPPDVFSLGQDVTAVARPGGVDPTQLCVGSLVGVKRSNGSVTVGRVETPLSCTPSGYIHVALGEEDRKRKDVPPDQLYSLTAAPAGGEMPTSGQYARAGEILSSARVRTRVCWQTACSLLTSEFASV